MYTGKSEKDGGRGLAFVRSFGCAFSVSDGERIRGMLSLMGYGDTDSPDDADIVVFNTCAVREHAEQRVFGNIGALKKQHEENPDMIICVCGCMTGQEHIAEKIKTSYPYVDIVCGANELELLPGRIEDALRGKKTFRPDTDGKVCEDVPYKRSDSARALVPIMYGCNNFCSYCVVPYVRGRERSRDSGRVLESVRELVRDGCREITLIGQNVNSYGNDRQCEIKFPELLRRVNAIPGDFKIGFMSSHPKDASDELLQAIADCEKVYKHIHLPVQSGNDHILSLMKRRYTVRDYMGIVERAREIIPGLSLSTDVIVGFPGETYAEFCDTVTLLRQVGFDTVYSFIYSPRVGTAAAVMEDPVSREEKGVWFSELLSAQRGREREIIGRFTGTETQVLIGEKKYDGTVTGKTGSNMTVEISIGDRQYDEIKDTFVNVKITGHRDFFLTGEIIK